MKKGILILVLMLLFAGAVQAASIHGTFEGYNIVKVYSSDGQELTAANPAINFKGTTMVPIRMIEQLGFTVEWGAETYSVNVTPPEPVVIEVLKEEISTDEPSEEPANEPEEEPTEPTQPFTPTEPGGSTEPTQPTEPSEEPQEPEPREPSDPEPTEPEEPQEEPQEPEEPAKPDNTAMCQAIRDEYAGKIAMLSYTTKTTAQYNIEKYKLEVERDQKLFDAGCN